MPTYYKESVTRFRYRQQRQSMRILEIQTRHFLLIRTDKGILNRGLMYKFFIDILRVQKAAENLKKSPGTRPVRKWISRRAAAQVSVFNFMGLSSRPDLYQPESGTMVLV
jgi:hypothetical protein